MEVFIKSFDCSKGKEEGKIQLYKIPIISNKKKYKLPAGSIFLYPLI